MPSIFDHHILQLADRLEQLRDSLIAPNLADTDRIVIESQIRVVRQALLYALELDRSISQKSIAD